MLKIGIELNGIVRDINKQYLKYYLKDINPAFDDTDIDMNVNNFIDKLPFESKSAVKKFIYEDYPYELFGCAAPMSRNLHTFINGWVHEMLNDRDIKYDICFFSLGEEELSIQSTYFYLSKSGSRVRRVFFPMNYKELYDEFNVIVTTRPEVVMNAKDKNVVILINKNDNQNVKQFADICYDNLEKMMQDTDYLCETLFNENKNIKKHRPSWWQKITYALRKKFNGRKTK